MNAFLVSLVYLGPWTIIETNAQIILWTLLPICLATCFFIHESMKFARCIDSFPLKVLIVAFGPFWPFTLLIIALTGKDNTKLELLTKAAKAYMIAAFTLLVLPQCLQIFLMTPSMTNCKWANFVFWALMLIWFFLSPTRGFRLHISSLKEERTQCAGERYDPRNF